MNINDLKPGSYKVIKAGSGIQNVSQFPTEQPETVKTSFMQKLGQFGLGAAKGAANTIRGSLNLVGQGLEAIAPAPKRGETVMQSVNTVIPEKAVTPTNTAQKAGFITEQIAEFLVPGSGVTKAGKIAQAAVGASKTGKAAGFVARSAIEAGGAAGMSAVQGGDAKTAASIGAAVPTVGRLFGVLGSGGKNAAKYVSSTLSGVPEAAIEEAFRNPIAVRAAITRAANEGTELSAQRIHKQALNALDELKRVRGVYYKEGLNQITTDPRTNAVAVSLSGIKSLATKTLKQFGLNAAKKNIDIGTASLQKSHLNKLQELVDRVYSWKEVNPKGLNDLRQVMDGYKVGGINLNSSDKQFNAIIAKLRSNLSDYVGEKVPEFKEMNRTYAAQSEVIDNVRSQLKLGSADPNTALRKLVSVFNPKSNIYRPLVKELGDQAGVDLMSDIAGLTMAQWSPQGLGRYITGVLGNVGAVGGGIVGGIPGAAVPLATTAALSSPKLIGKAVTKAGKIAPTTKRAAQRAAQVIKGAIYQTGKNREKRKP